VKKIILGLLFAGGMFAQSMPQFLFGTGVTASPYSSAPNFLGKISSVSTFAVRVSDSNLYSWSSLQMIPGVTSGAILSTGVGYAAYTNGACSLLAIGTAGLTVNTNVSLGTFSGGGALACLINKANNIYILGGMSVTGISGNTVQPNFGLGIFKSF
jgi:hypothetical protein